MTQLLSFPHDFIWGAATAAYQIEGAWDAGGKGESIWDRFSHTPGMILNGDTGDLAADHIHRYQEDIGLMQELGLAAYRLSVSWPRILPAGRGQVNPAGLDFYDRLIDALLAAGIRPFITLYHWDLPQALQDAGGWQNRDTAYWFRDYADVLAQRLGDRISNWITHNEPWVTAFLGHYFGIHAPGLHSLDATLSTAHHLLLSHGLALEPLRYHGSESTQVGITLDISPAEPASDSAGDEEAARRQDGIRHRLFLDPLFRGRYPEDMADLFDGQGLDRPADDLRIISQPIDFLGLNYYTRAIVKAAGSSAPFRIDRVQPAGAEFTDMGWEVYPTGLYDALMRVHRDYAPSRLYVTESGAAFSDVADSDGQVRDPRREAFLREHFIQAHRAIAGGVPLKGYFVWSLLDNFEWAFGYSKRFGLIWVNFETQQRIIKQSGRWFAGVTRENGVLP